MNTPTTTVDANLVAAQKEIKEKIDAYFTLKNQISDSEKVLKEMKKDLITFMEATDTPRLEGDNCKISLVVKATPSVPKDVESKKKLFNWIAENKGQEVLDEMLTFNSRSFGSFYNAEETAAIEDGNLDFAIDGVEEPHNVTSITVRKK